MPYGGQCSAEKDRRSKKNFPKPKKFIRVRTRHNLYRFAYVRIAVELKKEKSQSAREMPRLLQNTYALFIFFWVWSPATCDGHECDPRPLFHKQEEQAYVLSELANRTSGAKIAQSPRAQPCASLEEEPKPPGLEGNSKNTAYFSKRKH